jgi:hypothetical protein
MTRRGKVFSLLGVGLIIIIILVIWLIMTYKQETATEDEAAPVNTVEVAPEKTGLIKTDLTEEDKVTSSVRSVAVMFVERFGTFTNHSNFESIKELAPLMTSGMNQWIETSYLPKLNKEHDPAGFFYRITAKAPVVDVLELSKLRAKLKLTVQREEMVGTAEPTQFIQDIIVDFKLVDKDWLVDAAFWQDKR